MKRYVRSAEIPAGYLKTTRITTPYIKTDDQRNALEALEIAITEKFDQFEAFCDRQLYLTSDSHWSGTITEYDEGYYIKLEATRCSFQAFVSFGNVIRAPRNRSEEIGTYDVQGNRGLVEYMSRRR